MAKSSLDIAHGLLRRRKFSEAIILLESNEDIYQGSFDFYLTLGTACLYAGEVGNARRYFGEARKIGLTDPRLLLGQAALYLRRGSKDDTALALQYYLEVQSVDKSNPTAARAIEFIRENGDGDTISKWVETGRIEAFYPPLGVNPAVVRNGVLAGLVLGAVLSVVLVAVPRHRQKVSMVGPRANLTRLELTDEESRHAQEENLSGTVARYLLDNAGINKSYRAALVYFQDGRDNACRVEINRILSSNASLAIKQKANILGTYLEVPTFDSLLDNYTYREVAEDPALYLDCYVAWSGRVANAQSYPNGSWACDLLVGYETMQTVEGSVRLSFDPAPEPPVDVTRAVRVLARVSEEDGGIVLIGRSVYQPVDGVSVGR